MLLQRSDRDAPTAPPPEPASGVLQPETGTIRGDVYLPATVDTVLWGRLPCEADAPVLTVEPGTTVTIDTVSHEGMLEDQGKDPVRYFGGHGVPADEVLTDVIEITGAMARDPERDGPHVVVGPIRIEGAEVGDLVALIVLETTPRVPYGVISNRHGRGSLPGELPRTPGTVSVFTPIAERDGVLIGRLPVVEGGERVVEFPLRPFLGIMGVAVPGTERPHSVPPGRHGGNLDIRLLTAGSTLYVPVQVPGALAYVGDPHFAQGDGEVALTALEASLRVTVRFDLVKRADALAEFGDLAGPLGRTADYLVPTGHDADLDEAVRDCVRQALTLIRTRWGLDEHLAYAYLSAATDFRISQVVDLVSGVHACIRESDFERVER